MVIQPIGNSTFKKVLLIIIPMLIGFGVSWAVWTTVSIFSLNESIKVTNVALSATVEVRKTIYTTLQADIADIKQQNKDIQGMIFQHLNQTDVKFKKLDKDLQMHMENKK